MTNPMNPTTSTPLSAQSSAPRPHRTLPKVLLAAVTILFALIAVILVIGVLTNGAYFGLRERFTSTQERSDLRKIVATGEVSLDQYCAEGYYVIPGEKRCSRAPKCGGAPYDSYKWVAENVPMPDYGECTDEGKGPLIGNPPNTNPFYGYVPLCCYEVARTHDPERCVSHWERLWCHPDQCAQINNASGCEGGDCQCGEGLKTWCDQKGCDLKPPVPLSTRLNLNTGNAPLVPSPTSASGSESAETLTPSPTTSLDTNPTATPTNPPGDAPLSDSTPTSAPGNEPRPTNTPPTDPFEPPTPTIGIARSTPTPTDGKHPTNTPNPPKPTDTLPTLAQGPHCDTSCGVCGWKDAQGVCHTEGAVGNSTQLCCYFTCLESSCVAISGYGANRCASDANCQTQAQTTPTVQATTAPLAQVTTGTSPQAQTQPPVSGDSRWALLLLIPVIVIVGAIAF